MPNSPFTLSIEPVQGKSFIHGFHLGTVEGVARQCAAEQFHGRNRNGAFTRTVALIRDNKLVGVYDGEWR